MNKMLMVPLLLLVGCTHKPKVCKECIPAGCKVVTDQNGKQHYVKLAPGEKVDATIGKK